MSSLGKKLDVLNKKNACTSLVLLFPGSLIRYVLAATLIITLFVNLTFVLETLKNGKSQSDKQRANGVDNDNNNNKNNNNKNYDNKGAAENGAPPPLPRRLVDLRVVSSRTRVEIAVAGVKVVEDTKARGIHVAVLHQVKRAHVAVLHVAILHT